MSDGTARLAALVAADWGFLCTAPPAARDAVVRRLVREQIDAGVEDPKRKDAVRLARTAGVTALAALRFLEGRPVSVASAEKIQIWLASAGED
ncbi:MAG: hypothetical protein QF893_24630 [Alphaproteobacteria bacterium]|jgi:hypothetical protein|nr:hypothetical protein [Alphaproteobacteria bacterium]